MSKLRTVSFSILLLEVPVLAQTNPEKAPEKTLETVTVQGDRIESTSEKTKAYTVEKTSSATKLDITALETPQTVHVVTRQQMDDFGLSNARDVLATTPGVIVQNQETDRTSYGTRGSEISNFQTDGLGVPFSDYNYQNGDVDTFIYDRVEVVKGANGLTTSLGDPGASVNFIRKRPTRDLQTILGLSYGSWNTRRVEADVSGAFDAKKKFRGRLVGAGQEGESYLDNYKSKKNVFSAVLEGDLSDSTTVTLGHSEQRNNPRGNNWGALPLLDQDGKQLSYDRSYNPVPDWVKWDKTTKKSFVELKQSIGSTLTLKATWQAIRDEEDSALLYYNGVPDAEGNGVPLWPSLFLADENQDIYDVNLSGTFPLLGRDHEFVVGVNGSKNKVKQKSFDADFESLPGINWYDWDGQFAKPEFTYTDVPESGADYDEKISNIYGAVRVHATEDLRILLGASQTTATSSGNNYGGELDYDKSRSMPYAGITYNISPNSTVYTSYSTIFRPQSSRGEDGKVLDPVDGLAYELGVKSSWLDDALTGSIAFFKTEQNNYPLRASDSSSIIKLYEVVDLRTEGLELDLVGKVTDTTNLVFGYVNVKMKDETSGEATRTYLPSQIFNVLVTQEIPPVIGFKVGAGLTWQSRTHQDVEGSAGEDREYKGTIREGSYALLNLMASYQIKKNISVQANGSNVTDKKYLNSFPDGQGFYGAPANYTVAVSFRN